MHIVVKTLSITQKAEIINKREFIVAIHNADNKSFVVPKMSLVKPITMSIQPFYQAKIALLISKKIGILSNIQGL